MTRTASSTPEGNIAASAYPAARGASVELSREASARSKYPPSAHGGAVAQAASVTHVKAAAPILRIKLKPLSFLWCGSRGYPPQAAWARQPALAPMNGAHQAQACSEQCPLRGFRHGGRRWKGRRHGAFEIVDGARRDRGAAHDADKVLRSGPTGTLPVWIHRPPCWTLHAKPCPPSQIACIS